MRSKLRRILNLRKIASSPTKLFLALIFILFAFFLQDFTKSSESFEARVIKVIDGDTLDILSARGKERVRIYGIDAPELKQEFGHKVKTYLQGLILNQKLTINYKNKDKYGRIVACVELGEKDIGKHLVSEGYAWAYWGKSYEGEQMKARESKKGLWQSKNPIEPFRWRKANK
ncbi:thermonuclease family protein [Campylobacter helveticus]|uniref:thermonuclease family protein n=1 Tax=Campylobacter helveticus TaxID=28898 RepID=UPI001116F9F9|nr:thermonuclease family protein [Campylobacter helveticus]TNH35608.1 thermonuclease family protein [Campylobacter helveticus]TNH37218.1 thermonuclease family protein [Campylobacter helveticus]